MDIESNVDFVFLLDASDSMKPLISMLKHSTLYEKIAKKLEDRRRNVNKIRFKVVWYRAMKPELYALSWGESDFFVLPDEEKAFCAYLDEIPIGGKEERTFGLDALIHAMRSEWNYSGDKQRHIIILFSDKKVDLSENANKSNPIEKFESEWELDRTLRLVLVTPNVFPWTYITENIPYVAGFVIEENQGIREFEVDEIIRFL